MKIIRFKSSNIISEFIININVYYIFHNKLMHSLSKVKIFSWITILIPFNIVGFPRTRYLDHS